MLGGVEWIKLNEDTDKYRTFVNTVMNLRVSCNVWDFLTSWQTISLSRTAFHVLVLAPAQCWTAIACPFGVVTFLRPSRAAGGWLQDLISGGEEERLRLDFGVRNWPTVRLWQLSLLCSHTAQNTCNRSHTCRASRPACTPAGVSGVTAKICAGATKWWKRSFAEMRETLCKALQWKVRVWRPRGWAEA